MYSRKVISGEQRMRRVTSLLAVGVALFIGAQSAKADMVMTGTKVAGTGALAGWDIWQLSVLNNGANGTNDNIIAWDLTVTSADSNVIPAGFQPFWFWKSANGLSVSQKGVAIIQEAERLGLTYVQGINQTGFVTGDSFGTAVNRGQGTFLGVVGTGPSGNEYGPGGASSGWIDASTTPSGSSNATYSTTKTMRTSGSYGFSNAGFPNDKLTGTLRAGNVIVPAGNTFTVTGNFLPIEGGNTALAKYQVNFTNAVPEPASLGLVGIAMMALGRRRRA
jgi:hypothetical protein